MFSVLSLSAFGLDDADMRQTSKPKTPRRVLVGNVYNSISGEAIPYVTIQALGTGKSTLTNESGFYRLIVEKGEHEVKFSHVGFFSDTVEIIFVEDTVRLDIKLEPTLIELPGTKVYSRAYDPGQRIIIEAIKRKKDILTQINDYNFDAYTKLVVHDRETDSTDIFLITETQVTSYWAQPDRYKEVITARKQSSNLPPEGNLVAVGEILNFNKNRLDFGDYEVVTPTAKDALKHYNYYLLDTIEVDGRPVFRLEIEPKSQIDPLFVGFIHIADSTFDVVAVDVGFNEGVYFPFVSDLRYRQDFAKLNGKYWMPVKIVFSGFFKLNIPVPGIPSELSFEHLASIYNYRFETGESEGMFDEYELVVADDADDIDSAVWYANQTVPLTDEELYGYKRIDSIQNLPKPLVKKILAYGIGTAFFLALGGQEDIFHYNRVEGAYLGLNWIGMGLNPNRFIPNLDLWLRTGYSFEQEKWQHRYGFSYELSNKRKLYFGAEYQDQIVKMPTVNSSEAYNPTLLSLFYKMDPYDYYRQKGFQLFTGYRPVNHVRLRFSYYDYEHYPTAVTEHYSVFRNDDLARYNPLAERGKLRSIGSSFRYDSRKLFKNKDEDYYASAAQYTRLMAWVEYADPDLIDNDFKFTRYSLSLFRRQRLFGLGISNIYLFGGQAENNLPVQKFFILDFGEEIFINNSGFNTLNETNFYGDRVFKVYVNHEFGHNLFYKSGLPLIKKIPFTLSVHGGAFWSEFERELDPETAGYFPFAPTAYTELGFSLGNLTPFMNPFNMMLGFTWQLSDYNTSDFSIQWGFEL
ncbi:MAG: carboxypeptidase-like regulatory domain-containing protein [candidate division Zixibacteria bacterium]|nr:carboxypeptidase-like regulatory domain-containing protein [candidate division Zixibacteria bacterium]